MIEFKKANEPLYELISYWDDGNIDDKPMTWRSIVDVLRSFDHPKLAAKIEKEYCCTKGTPQCSELHTVDIFHVSRFCSSTVHQQGFI